MRITVEIHDDQRAELLELAAQRGERDLSAIVREAIDAYLAHQRACRKSINAALAQRGTLSDADAESTRASIQRLRARWR